MKTFTNRDRNQPAVPAVLDWNPTLRAQLARILAAKCGDADAPVMGDFGPVKAIRFGDAEGPIMGEPLDRPQYGDFSPVLGDFSPVLGDFSPPTAEYGRIRLRPLIPPMKCKSDIRWGDEDEDDGQWSITCGDEDENDDEWWIVKCGEQDHPVLGVATMPICGEVPTPIKYGTSDSPVRCGTGNGPIFGKEDDEDGCTITFGDFLGEPAGPLFGDGIAPIKLVACF